MDNLSVRDAQLVVSELWYYVQLLMHSFEMALTQGKKYTETILRKLMHHLNPQHHFGKDIDINLSQQSLRA